jgi:PIN domain nuclease of toxin-antitoxin system
MDLLLDTHTFLWWETSDPQLGSQAKVSIGDPENRVFVSVATVWEIAVKAQAGRLGFTGSPSKNIADNGFLPLPIAGEHAELAAKLPPIHKDPFDRILVAQALARSLVLVTADRLIQQYDVPQLPARGA